MIRHIWAFPTMASVNTRTIGTQLSMLTSKLGKAQLRLTSNLPRLSYQGKLPAKTARGAERTSRGQTDEDKKAAASSLRGRACDFYHTNINLHNTNETHTHNRCVSAMLCQPFWFSCPILVCLSPQEVQRCLSDGKKEGRGWEVREERFEVSSGGVCVDDSMCICFCVYTW